MTDKTKERPEVFNVETKTWEPAPFVKKSFPWWIIMILSGLLLAVWAIKN